MGQGLTHHGVVFEYGDFHSWLGHIVHPHQNLHLIAEAKLYQ